MGSEIESKQAQRGSLPLEEPEDVVEVSLKSMESNPTAGTPKSQEEPKYSYPDHFESVELRTVPGIDEPFTKMRQFSIKDFSTRATIAVICFILLSAIICVGNFYLVYYEYIHWTNEFRMIIWFITLYQFVTVIALFYEMIGEIFCCCCYDGPYHQRKEGVSILIAAYFPNEKGIIKDTLENVIYNVECDRNVNITLVYNTPKPACPEEVEMLKYHKKVLNDRKVYVIKNETSTSKAENLNFGVAYLAHKKDLQAYTYIIDADHHPDHDCLQRLVQTLEADPKTDCVHGTTYIRNRTNSGHGCIARVVDAEFFYFYNLLLPSLQCITGNAFFGGSNGIWRTTSLVKFDNKMLTEDIDMSIRSLLDHKNIVPEYRARSGELIPEGPGALYQQRMRWAIGWNEVTYKYSFSYFGIGCKTFSLRRFCGLVFILLFRYLAFIFFAFSMTFQWLGLYGFFPEYPVLLKSTELTFYLYIMVSLLLVIIRFPYSIKNLDISCCGICDQFIFLLIFFLGFFFYLLWNAFLELYSTFKIICRKDAKWVVTTRADTAVQLTTGNK